MSENILGLLRDMHSARKQGPAVISQPQRARLSEMIAFARANSPYYRELYHDLPERVEDPTLLPVTSKKALTEHFDDWVTDCEVTYEKVHAFVDNPNLIGERFLDKYLVATTSGFSGTRGIFVIDDRTLHVATAASICMMLTWLNAADILRIAVGSGRTALVIATGGHFTGALSKAACTASSAAGPSRSKERA
jgi:phenylacetate-coenzyme A ligase PaaK-like adenylate-forming protein